MIKQIILHIGYPKTATTTIQKFLFEHKEKIENFDIFSFNPDGTVNKSGNCQKTLPYKKSKTFKLKGFNSWKIDALKSYLFEKKQNNNNEKILISAERFILTNKKSIKEFKKFLSTFTDNFKVIVYLRRQDQSACSFFQESCKPNRKMTYLWGVTGEILPNKNDMDAMAYFNYFEMLKAWEESFGVENIIPRIFDKSRFIRSNIIIDFLTNLDISISSDIENKVKEFKNANISLSRMQQQGLIYAYKNRLTIDERRLVYSKLKFLKCSGKLLPSKSQAIKFYNYFHESNEKLLKKYNFGSDSLFDDNFENYLSKSNLSLNREEKKELELFYKQHIGKYETQRSIISKIFNKVRK
ncbi:hypothetical protein [Thalassotalea crassostreae]|uniref:hypothetical protein n=1 Tax=Thalassotalea crassostreae TaxID=1763536 RepID=UPI000838FD6E|nr:hypothetical protein [Thalassotalea crassostreae]